MEFPSLITGVFDRDSSRHMESQMGLYEGAGLRNVSCSGEIHTNYYSHIKIIFTTQKPGGQ
jgi:hypothetical protein